VIDSSGASSWSLLVVCIVVPICHLEDPSIQVVVLEVDMVASPGCVDTPCLILDRSMMHFLQQVFVEQEPFVAFGMVALLVVGNERAVGLVGREV